MSKNLKNIFFIKIMIAPIQSWFDGGSLVRIGQKKGLHNPLHDVHTLQRERNEHQRFY